VDNAGSVCIRDMLLRLSACGVRTDVVLSSITWTSKKFQRRRSAQISII
jgi:hypothetical protein